MNDEDAGLAPPAPPLEEDIDAPLLEQARQIERDMYEIMATQVKLARVQIALAGVSILIALIIAALR